MARIWERNRFLIQRKEKFIKIERSVDEEHKWFQGREKIWDETWKQGRMSKCKKRIRRHFRPKKALLIHYWRQNKERPIWRRENTPVWLKWRSLRHKAVINKLDSDKKGRKRLWRIWNAGGQWASPKCFELGNVFSVSSMDREEIDIRWEAG